MLTPLSEVEKMFYSEVRDKKRTASGVHHKTGKNGYVGTMRFPSDIMSRKDKIRYRRSSKVMVSNMYDEIMPIENFDELETADKKNRMQYWRANNTIKEIQDRMGISGGKFYNILAELELPVSRGGFRGKRKAKSTVQAEKKEENLPAEKEEKAPVQEIIVDGLHLVYNGTYSAEQIIKQLSKFELLLDGEPDQFYIELKLMQKQPK